MDIPAGEDDPEVEVVCCVRPVSRQTTVDDGGVRAAVVVEAEPVLVDQQLAHADGASRYQVLLVAFVAVNYRHLEWVKKA